MDVLCPYCHQPIPSGAKTCSSCGRFLTATVQGSGAAAAGVGNIVSGERGVAAKSIDRSTIDTGDRYYVPEDDLTVHGRKTRNEAVFPRYKKDLQRPARIFSGRELETTKVLGFVMADMVEIGDYCLIEGSVFGIKGVQVGRNSSIEGIVMSPEKVAIGSSSAARGIFTQRANLEAGCMVQGDVFCDELGDADENGANLDGSCKVEGVLASSRSLTVGDGAYLGSIVCDAHVTLGNNVEVTGIIQATGTVIIGECCTVTGGIVASRVEVGSGSRLGFIICSETASLGQSVEVGFLHAVEGIGRLGAGSRIGSPTLLSPQSPISMEAGPPVYLSGVPVNSLANLLGMSSKCIIESQTDHAPPGSLLTVLLTRTLYSLIRNRSGLAPLALDK